MDSVFRFTCKVHFPPCAVAVGVYCLVAVANAADVNFSVNSTLGVHPISPYVYGANSSLIANRTFDRSGGNRMTGYNWETNASNAGADWYHHSDYHLTGGQANQPPGAAVSGMIQSAGANGRGAAHHRTHGRLCLRRRAMAPWTKPRSRLLRAGKRSSQRKARSILVHRCRRIRIRQITTSSPMNSSTGQRPRNKRASPFGTASTMNPGCGAKPCQPAGNPACSPIRVAIRPMARTRARGGRTHPTIHPYAPTFAEMRDKTIAHASAIKDVQPEHARVWRRRLRLERVHDSSRRSRGCHQSVAPRRRPDGRDALQRMAVAAGAERGDRSGPQADGRARSALVPRSTRRRRAHHRQ